MDSTLKKFIEQTFRFAVKRDLSRMLSLEGGNYIDWLPS